MSKKLLAAAMTLCTLACVDGNYVFGQAATPADQRATRKADGQTQIDENSNKSAGERAREGVPTKTDQPGTAVTTVRDGGQTQAHAGYTQHDLAVLMTICNEGEVALSQIGAQKAQHSDVKKFAEEMVKVHTDMIAKIQQADAAGIAAADRSAAQPNQQAAQPNQQANRNAADDVVGRRSSSVDASESGFVALHREIAAQCRQSKEEELSKKEGAEFDKCFMGAQLGAHMSAIDSMKVFQRHTSGELKSTIDEGIKTAEAHLEHAKKIMKDLETAAK